MKRTLLFTMLAALISGCASNPELRDTEAMTPEGIDDMVKERQQALQETWSREVPSLTYLDRGSNLYVEKLSAIPDELKDGKELYGFTMKRGATLERLDGLLYPYGVRVMFQETEDGGRDLGKLPFNVKKFNGSLGELLSMIEELHNVTFDYIGNNTLRATERSFYIASMPQQEDVLESVKENLESLGAKNLKTNLLSGSLIYEASTREQNHIEQFFTRFYENYATVQYQLTVFNVALDRNISDGFNWNELDIIQGSIEAALSGGVIDQMLAQLSGAGGGTNGTNGTNGGGFNNGGGTNNGGTNNGGNNNGGTNGNDNMPNFGYSSRYDGTSIDDIKGFTWLNSEKFEAGVYNENLSLSIAVDWMNQYGDTRAEQSVFSEIVTGKQAEFSSKRKVPIIGDQQTSFVGTQSPTATQSFQTENEEVGVTVKLKPFYDASAQEVTMEIELDLSSIIGVDQLQTATGATVKQYITEEQKLPTTVRMKVGETKLLGGLIFESISETRTTPNIIETRGYINRETTKTAMFVLIRPTVRLFRSPDIAKHSGKSTPKPMQLEVNNGHSQPVRQI